MDSQASEIPKVRPKRREKTQERICAAAREVFLTCGFDAATMEGIASAAGTRRSTVYNHFRDKNEILGAIAQDYLVAVTEVIDRIPGPKPTRRQIDTWVRDFADFATRERVPTLLLVHFSGASIAPQAAALFGVRLIEAMAKRLPAFAEAMQPGQPLALARAIAVLRELGCALSYHVEFKGQELSPQMLEVAAQLLERFVRGRF
jgi:AcrR family transcriptional regulator